MIVRPGPLSGVLPASGSTLDNNLVAYWKMDEGSGTRVDSVGSNDLTESGTLAGVTGILNDAVECEASNSEYLTASDDSALRFTGDFTISAWFNIAATTGSDQTIVSKENGTDRELLLFYSASFAYMRCYLFGNSSFVLLDYSGTGISTGTWYNVIAYRSGNTFGLTVNDGTPVTGDASGIGSTGGGADFRVGGTAFAGINYMNGLIDEVGKWSRALTSGERTTLYGGGTSPPVLP